MDTITVDKSGNLVYYHQQYKKTNEPKPTPLDPSLLSQYKQGYEDGLNAGEEDADSSDDAASGAGLTEEEQEAQDAVQESQDETQAAAEEAGVEPLPEAGDDV